MELICLTAKKNCDISGKLLELLAYLTLIQLLSG